MFRRFYQAKRLLGSHSFVIIALCLFAFWATFERAAAGTITERDAMMFTAGVWCMGIIALLLRLIRTLSRRW